MIPIMQNLKPIKIATQGVAHDFRDSLFPAILNSIGFAPVWSKVDDSQLIIFGPFSSPRKRASWIPKPLRPFFRGSQGNESHKDHHRGPPSLFITGENIRHDFYKCDYSISFDLGVVNSNHYRMPYWMEMVDWSHEGIIGNRNPRFGRLLSLDRLLTPLGEGFIARPRKAAIFASHLNEPRRTLLDVVQKCVEVVKFGRSFNPSIKNHLESSIIKFDELQKFAFNLCPENGMYPGYYTEKIPEAFMAGCLPISWADENVRVDFNPKAFINLAPMTSNNFSELQEILHSPRILNSYAEQPLLNTKPSLENLKRFIKNIISEALS